MRKWMKLVEYTSDIEQVPLTESPQESGDTNFNLDDPTHNRTTAEELLSSDLTAVVEDNSETVLLHYRSDKVYFFILIDKHQKQIIAWSNFREEAFPKLGSCLYQNQVWRHGHVNASGYPSKIVFEYALTIKPTIVCGRVQTRQGRIYWEALMRKALDRNLAVGLIDGDQIDLCKGDLMAWIAQQDAWGTSEEMQHRRFFISSRDDL